MNTISPLWVLASAGIAAIPFLWEFRSVVLNPLRKLLSVRRSSQSVDTPADNRRERHAALCLWSDFASTMKDKDQKKQVEGAIERLAVYSTEKA